MNAAAALPPAGADWHPEDVKAAVRKRGWNFRRIARVFEYAPKSPDQVVHRPWRAMELIVGAILETDPWEIWPSRYTKDGPESRAAMRRAMQGLRRRMARTGPERGAPPIRQAEL
ncbi:MAG: helix-turn-helix domain-containing protein [Thermodesulfobacteriota bacterium]